MKLGWNNEYSEYIHALYPDPKLKTRSITFQITDSCNLKCSYCLTGDTTILMSDFSYKEIRDIKVGDNVMGFNLSLINGDWKLIQQLALVKTCFKREVNSIYHLTTADGHVMKITGNHRVLISRDAGDTYQWEEVSKCEPYKTYMIYYGASTPSPMGVLITGLKKVKGNFTVYNIETDTGNYFANNLAVHNCYQINKKTNMMTKETARACVDLLFDLWDKNDPDSIINHSTKALILDYIGGEPLLNVPIMDFINSYFMERCIELHHPWALTWRASICSNGLNYFNQDFQDYLKKWGHKTSFAITLDGPQEIHDECRKDHNGKGSFARAYSASVAHKAKYGDKSLSTKITLAPENINKMGNILDFFLKENYYEINGNPAFEPKWTYEHARIYYDNLKKFADRLLNEDREIHTNLFMDFIGKPIPSFDLQNNCGGQGEMLAFDTQGIAYPCLRFMPSSLGDSIPPLIIGSAQEGLYSTKEQQLIREMLKKVNRRTKSSDECFNCPIASGCMDCAGWNYQENGTVNSRSTNICPMHKARVLANCYYWNMKKQGSFPLNLSDEESLKIVSPAELALLKSLSTKKEI